MPSALPTGQPSRIPRIAWIVILLVAALVLGGEMYWLKRKREQRISGRALPVLATVPEFSFTSEKGTPLTREDLKGKIWVADFIFTRCAGPCPFLTEQMRKLQAAISGDSDVRLISVTVDPAYDRPDVLARYAAKYGANPDRWSFLTGDPATVEKFVTKGMLLGLSKDGEGQPMHAQKFAVVDREGHIRAYRDLSEGEGLLPRLIEDIHTLKREKSAPMPATKQP